MIELLVQQTNLYSPQNRRNFLTNAEEMKAFISVNYIMAVNQLSSYHNFVGKVGIQNTFARTRYQEVLQNLHFADNTKQGKPDKGFKIRPIINLLKKLFQAVLSIEYLQSIDEHMTKFKGRSSMREQLKIKLVK